MDQTESQAPHHTKRHVEHQNEDSKDEEEEERVSRISDSHGVEAAHSSDAELRNSQLETLANDDRSDELQVNSTLESKEGTEYKEKVNTSHQEVSPSLAIQSAEAPTQNRLQLSVSPTSLSQLSLTSVTQGISSAPTPTLQEQSLSDQNVNGASAPEANQQKSYNLEMVSFVPIVKTHASDGYNWRKYGQKQVKSPKGSRSYYRCTFSDCPAKKIECSDETGHVIEIVDKGMHSHEPPRKNNYKGESKSVSSAALASHNVVTAQPITILNDSDPSTSSKESVPETTVNPERKRLCSSGPDENGDVQLMEELLGEPEQKKRMKKGNAVCYDSVLKTWKNRRFVVHAAGAVGISDGENMDRKWNYYRCTSAGCPVRKHIETAVDNTNGVIITYKGVHDHDMPVPKKRHGQPSAPLVAAAAPASKNKLQLKKTDGGQNQVKSTQLSVGTEGESTGEALDLGGEKAIESARTLLSIGIEIKPC